MSRPAKISRRRPRASSVRRAQRKARGLYILRVPHKSDHDIIGHTAVLSHQQRLEASEYVHRTPHRWQVIVMLSCHGDRYRVWAECTTEQAFIAVNNGIVPLLQEALRQAEDMVNPNHDREFAMIARPVTDVTESAEPALLRAADMLGIDRLEAMEIAR